MNVRQRIGAMRRLLAMTSEHNIDTRCTELEEHIRAIREERNQTAVAAREEIAGRNRMERSGRTRSAADVA